jgi:hypothetical protein
VYTRFFLEQIFHAYDRNLIGKKVCELGNNSWDTRLNGMLKARESMTVCETAQEFFKHKGSTLKQYNRTPPMGQQAILAKDVFENSIDTLPAFKQLHDLTQEGGVMILNCPLGVTHHLGSISIAALVHLSQVNQYDVPFLAVSTENGDCMERVNTNQLYSSSKLKELLYKFNECIDLRVAATFIKTTNKEFQS